LIAITPSGVIAGFCALTVQTKRKMIPTRKKNWDFTIALFQSLNKHLPILRCFYNPRTVPRIIDSHSTFFNSAKENGPGTPEPFSKQDFALFGARLNHLP